MTDAMNELDVYLIGDGTMVRRGDLVDLTEGLRVAPNPERVRGRILVIDGDCAWVQFPSCRDPMRYGLHLLGRASPEPLPDFRAFFAERQGCAWPGRRGEHYDLLFANMAEALADYADELRKRA